MHTLHIVVVGCWQLCVEDKLLFTDDNFELVPAEGDIWPGATVAVTVVFRPTQPKQYRQVSGLTQLCALLC